MNFKCELQQACMRSFWLPHMLPVRLRAFGMHSMSPDSFMQMMQE